MQAWSISSTAREVVRPYNLDGHMRWDVYRKLHDLRNEMYRWTGQQDPIMRLDALLTTLTARLRYLFLRVALAEPGLHTNLVHGSERHVE